jgi:hypothetical protein
MEPRLPVDIPATVRVGEKRQYSVLSSVSTRGAFIEISAPPEVGSQLQLEFELSGFRYRGFARVMYQRGVQSDANLSHSVGVGVAFFGSDRDTERQLDEAIKRCEARYLP